MEALKLWLKLYIYPINISWEVPLWKLSSYKHQSFSYVLKHCQINEWLLELISLGNFYFSIIITDELQKASLFSSLGYGLIRIGKRESTVNFAPEEAPQQTWRFRRRNASLRFENCIQIGQESFPDPSGAPDVSEVSTRNHGRAVSN